MNSQRSLFAGCNLVSSFLLRNQINLNVLQKITLRVAKVIVGLNFAFGTTVKTVSGALSVCLLNSRSKKGARAGARVRFIKVWWCGCG